MALFSALVTTDDLAFRTALVRALRTQAVPIGVLGESSSSPAGPAVALADVRSGSCARLAAIERLRVKWPAAAIVAVANSSEPDVILQAMRAGANEFFACPTVDQSPRVSFEDGLRGALAPIVERLKAAQDDATPTPRTFAFFGAKGGAGTTTIAVNCAVQLAQLSGNKTILIELKPFGGEVALCLGAHPRYTLVDAIDNLHRLDAGFLGDLVTPCPSGLDILAGSDTLDRPNGHDAGPLEELLQRLGDYYEFIVIDAGNLTTAAAPAAVFVADSIFFVMDALNTAIQNPQRILNGMVQLGTGKDRIRVLLNRTSAEYFIAPEQIEAAIGYPIHHAFPNNYDTVSSALNTGVPVSLDHRSPFTKELVRFSRQLADLPERQPLGMERAS